MVKPVKQVTTEVQLRDFGTRLCNDTICFIIRPCAVDLKILKNHNGELANIGLLAADLLKADLLSALAEEYNLLRRPSSIWQRVLGCIFVVDGC
ncbi:hypothetical protein HG530_004742 [Fusarium avenaceum]|nr:hypothetical protein HG530_004742 [Fusarium avenaceum]